MGNFLDTLVASSLITASIVEAGETTKPLIWTPEQMMETKLISDVQLSPDNKTTLFVVTEAKIQAEKGVLISRIYKSTIHEEKSAIAFTSQEYSSTQPRWSPNGQWIAFLSNRTGTNNLYLIPAEGGEARALTKEKKDIQTFSWSPDGQKIAFVMADEIEDVKNKKKTSLAYEYKKDEVVNRLWLLDVFSAEPIPKALTLDSYCARGAGDLGTINCEFDWSPDSNNLVFAYSPGLGFDNYFLNSSLAVINLSTGGITPWKKQASYEALPRYSPDGKWVAYMTNDFPQHYAINHHVAIRSEAGLNKKMLAPTSNEGAFLAGPNLLGWTHDGKNVLFFEPKQTKYHIVLLPMDGSSAKELMSGDFFFKDPALSRDKTMLGFVGQTPTSPPEAFVAKLSNFAPLQISSLNASLPLITLKTEAVTWKSLDGLDIEGLLTYPANYESGKRYPLLLAIHGGPMGFFDETFLGTPNPYPFISFAESGLMILRPNPRGSTGYGKTFRCANYGDWAGMDFADLMTGVETLIAQGIADPERLGVLGWSYGGYMTSWIVSQTSRFKAASIGAGLSNLVSMSGTTDLHHLVSDYLGDFVNQRELYDERSPLNHAQKITTPCLIQHGMEDKRVSVSQAYELYHAIERQGNKPILLLYPGMGHRLTDPNMQLDAMKSNLEWFQTTILNETKL